MEFFERFFGLGGSMMSDYNEEVEKEEKSAESIYVEPASYFPEDVRKKYGLGEYYKEENDT